MTIYNFNKTSVHYSERGSGTPVLALHSSASTGAQWKNLADHMERRHRVITPDLPGYGRTAAWTGNGVASVESEARRIASLIRTCGEPVHLVGHSWGGAIALKIAMALPEWTKSLTLIEPAIFHILRQSDHPGDQRLFAEIRALAGAVSAAAAEGDSEAAMARFIDFWNGRDTWANTSPSLRVCLRDQIGQVINNFAAGFNEIWNLQEAAMVTCPTLAIMGLDSVPVTQRALEMLADTIPHTNLAIIPDAGHMVPLTDPHIVDPMISAHIRRAEEQSGLRADVRSLYPSQTSKPASELSDCQNAEAA